MALDPRIILAGQAPDIMGAYGRGLGVGQAQNQIGRENALAQLYKTQGAQIAAGDPAAVNALAGMDPMAAMQVQAGRQDMAAQRQRMDMLTREEQRAIADRAAAMSAAERAAAAEQIESAVRMGLMVRTPQEWDQMVAQAGAPQLAGQFGNREALAARYMSMADVLKRATPEPVAPLSSEGKFYWDQRRGFVPADAQPRAGVVVNTGDQGAARAQIGTVPQGFAAIPDPNSAAGYRMERIPGGPEDTRLQQARQAGARDVSSDVIVTAAARAREAAKGFAATGIAAPALRMVPSTSAAEVYRQTDVLKANAKVENLTAMRLASPTGGALGAVTEKEADMLAAKSGALDPASPNYLRDLDDYELTMLQIVHGPEAGQQIFESTRRDGAAPSPGPALSPGDDPLGIFQ